MNRLARAAAVAALAAAPVAVTAAPASAYCAALPAGESDVWYCTEPGYVCTGARTPVVGAGACYSDGEVSCYVDVPARPLIACAI